MPLPVFNDSGDLPDGIYRTTLDEVISRFGSGSPQRVRVTDRLRRVYNMAVATGQRQELVVFGSYVTDEPDPNDVDVVAVMNDEFRPENCSSESALLFDHSRANDELGASVFWIRPDLLLGEPLNQFLDFWRTKRDGGRRGIVGISP